MDFKIIKKIILGLLMTFGLLNAQNNLIFNRALTFKLVAQQGVTVPDGKVWKIESFKRDGAGSSILTVDIANGVTGSVTSASFISTPIWLEAGTILKPTNTTTNFSILEFNLSSANSGGGSGGLSSEGLEFNQVINYSGDGFLTNSNRSEILTSLNVPENKVWKITNVAMSKRSANVLSDNDGLNAQLGNQIIYSRFISGYSPPTVNYPIWISSGTHDLIISDGIQNGLPYRISISAIEYNIPQ